MNLQWRQWRKTMFEDMITVICSCGCDSGFCFKYLDGTIFIDLFTGYFGNRQKPVKSLVRDKFRLLKGKDPWISGAVIKRDEVIRIIDWLKAHPCNDDEVKNSGRLRLLDFNDDGLLGDDFDEYELMLYFRGSRLDILRGKEYRAGEIVLNEKERKRLIRHLASVIKEKK